MIRLIHTSDWHLGRSLFERKRYGEQGAFLEWLGETLEREGARVLLVCGDVFDSGTPSHTAQRLYYDFLGRVARTPCRHVVVVAGNHDSPAFLEAPRPLLEALRIHVRGSAADDPADEVLVLRDEAGEPELAVGAVPYLRDRDVRSVEALESAEDKARKLAEGVADHYRALGAAAAAVREKLAKPVPLVLTGHLFAAGGSVTEGDGVRELYVGSLARVAADAFPPEAAYVALGHLHAPQAVKGDARARYPGAPYALGFGEAGREKQVLRVDLGEGAASVTGLPVPVFQRLVRVAGDREAVERRLGELAVTGESAWLEVVYEGDESPAGLRERLDAAVEGTGLEILRILNNRAVQSALVPASAGETLDDLNPEQVFERCLAVKNLSDDAREELRATYREALAAVREGEEEA